MRLHRVTMAAARPAIVELCLAAFRFALEKVRPEECVRRALNITVPEGGSGSGSLLQQPYLTVANRTYMLNATKPNVHLVGIGKAAVRMIRGVEESPLRPYIAGGIASVPKGAVIPPNLTTIFHHGAANNLPDEDALRNAQLIADYVREHKGPEQVLIFLVSGGGSALLPAPVEGLTLAEKLHVQRVLHSNGANIRQLNAVRSALSRLKGGQLVRLAYPSRCIALIQSDIVGDPLELVASGPTVVPKEEEGKGKKRPEVVAAARALQAIGELCVEEQIPTNVMELLRGVANQKPGEGGRPGPIPNVNNVLVCNNRMLLSAMVDYFQRQNGGDGGGNGSGRVGGEVSSSCSLPSAASSGGMEVKVVSAELEGDATTRGKEFAKGIVELLLLPKSGNGSDLASLGGSGTTTTAAPLLSSSAASSISSFPNSLMGKEECADGNTTTTTTNTSLTKATKAELLLWGGETTVRFPPAELLPEGVKGGRNQEMVLAAFDYLLDFVSNNSSKSNEQPNKPRFAFLSLATDGRDGPTDAAGAYITHKDLEEKEVVGDSAEKAKPLDPDSLLSKVKEKLRHKDAYHFWRDYNGGANMVKLGEDGRIEEVEVGGSGTGTNLMDVQMLYVEKP